MNERMKILEMLSVGKIKPEEADALLKALGEKSNTEKVEVQNKKHPKFLCLNIEPKNSSGDKLNVRVPFSILSAGVKLAALIPAHAKSKVNDALESKGVNFNFEKLNSQNINEFIDCLGDISVDVDSGNERIRIYCE